MLNFVEIQEAMLAFHPQVTSLTKELYKTSGSFEFERRQSTSVRRSVDTRRPGGLSAHQARGEARIAKAEQAYKIGE